MKILFHQQSIELTTEQREHVELRLDFSLGRFKSRIRRIDVYLADTNGQRGGIDKRCRLVAKVHGLADVLIEDADSNFYLLVDRAAERLGRAISRRIERRHFGGLRTALDGSRPDYD